MPASRQDILLPSYVNIAAEAPECLQHAQGQPYESHVTHVRLGMVVLARDDCRSVAWSLCR